jgi:hypothetical protein
MLTIRDEQMSIFRAQARTAFETKMVRHISRCYPDEYAGLTRQGGDDRVRQFIRSAILRGARYGITTERALAGLIDLEVCYGPEFESRTEMEWAREILEDDSLEGPTKIDMLFELLPDE